MCGSIIVLSVIYRKVCGSVKRCYRNKCGSIGEVLYNCAWVSCKSVIEISVGQSQKSYRKLAWVSCVREIYVVQL